MQSLLFIGIYILHLAVVGLQQDEINTALLLTSYAATCRVAPLVTDC